ncbi:MAG: PadR family transcriptional regulator [Anaerococcus sp.]|nr:PadR family transcriptional regulator [Anaerococcus sp.]MDD7043866.1 PadR family transcriptional regulator [Peptoniphilaceae bacterium]MDY2919514.1 PadR family transcriptional regulator [Anaerococcus sp.]
MIESQMLKGVIDGIILHIIKNNETYGYEIVEELKNSGFYTMTEGTVYPILLRLSKKGLILGAYKKSKIGPKRKYYYITAKGRDYLDDFYKSYYELEQVVNKILKRGPK